MKHSPPRKFESNLSSSAIPDLILFNGRIYPDSEPNHKAEALAVSQGLILRIGPTKEILKLKSKRTKSIDLKRRVVLPGLSDSHIHLLNYGTLLLSLDLSHSNSIKAIQRQVSKKSASRARNDWILGRGWDDEKLVERRYPNRQDLDKVSSNPVFLKRVCGHVAVANSTALRISGITPETLDPEGGMIQRHPDGTPNGVLKERAIGLVEKNIPEPDEEINAALVLASTKLAKLGLTSLHCIVSDLNEFRALQMLKREQRILQSIYAIIPASLLDELASLGFGTDGGESGFRIGGVKLFLDGSMGARTAALNQPYSDDPSTNGMITITVEELTDLATTSKEAGFQMCIHAIGDKAVDLAIETIKSSLGAEETNRLRHRIEHVSLANREAVKKMQRLGIIASVQPRFILSDTWAKERLGPKRVPNLYPFGSMLESQLILAAGSDCPVEDPNPFEGIWSAVTRPGLEDNEGLTVSQAIAAYTTGAAYASHSERKNGLLGSGKFADFVVVDRDPFEVSPQSLRKTRVLRTFVRGKQVA